MLAPFSILHLSDLHIGPHCRFAGLDMPKLAERFASSVMDALQRLAPGERIGLVVVTGDIAEAGLPTHYADVRAFFDGLVGALGLPRSRFLFVPGNHDVSWPHCKIAEQQQPIESFDDAELVRRIDDVKLQPYRAFLAGFYDRAQGELEGVTALGHDAFVHDFDELGVSVATLNSCERESHRVQGGAFGERQAQALMNVWSQDAERLRIVAIHHNPVAVVPANVTGWIEHLRKKAREAALDEDLLRHFTADTLGLDGRDYLRRVTDDAQVSLLLHGHHHTLAPRDSWPWERRGPGQTHVLAAGSWGVDDHGLPPDQPLAVHLVRVNPAAGETRSLRLVYEPRARQHGHVVPGDFVNDPTEPQGCELALALPAAQRTRIAASTHAAGVDARAAIPHPGTGLDDRAARTAIREAPMLQHIRQIRYNSYQSSGWEELERDVAPLKWYAQEGSVEIRREVLEALTLPLTYVRAGMPAGLAGEFSGIVLSALRPYSPRPKAEQDILMKAIDHGFSLAYDGALYLQRGRVVWEGTQILAEALTIACRYELASVESYALQKFEGVRNAAARAKPTPFMDAIEWLRYKEEDAIAKGRGTGSEPQLNLKLEYRMLSDDGRQRATKPWDKWSQRLRRIKSFLRL